ncbi:hypothetical protein CGRA01v4_08456 [Colletotrichum graminicola]|uniref:Copper acquisition factor BIM1-like domain-containing protein n=1 Tax=Colletotrichum graminicola (strain M1.001 / M2 / FGSC 10212) TaxID=645133 RepID=E3R0D8_COLGM|nr:uncharacterized protein GLRG_11709 [Colletotrichum graminicola M1.001]EFQ36576.1 hypothetical protein GLRG_11709 [Colletotrichum graminicola M1.001]WDK17173.1 hypothetical protein CGRA01v4_08456 [Colletotrichum graminicola]
MKSSSSLTIVLGWLLVALAQGHTIISYPGWRGNTFVTNETYPFGMQWTYPCGGLGVTQNRTYWPIDGGAIAVQPGWNSGHKTALMYINLGLGEEPKSYTTVMVPRFLLTGPTNKQYEGTFCLPKVPIPEGVTLNEGDMASIQVVQAAQHGATLFSCVDVIFTRDQSKVAEVTGDNCFNSTDLKIEAATLETNSSPITKPSTITTAPPSPTSVASRTMIGVSWLVSLLLVM